MDTVSRKKTGIRLGLAVVVLAGVLAAPRNVAADINWLIIGYGGMFTHVSGATGGAGGAFTLQRFEVQDRQLVAVGQFLFSLCVLGVDPENCLATVEQQIAIPVVGVHGSCEHLEVIVGGLEVTDESLSDYVIHTSPATFEFAPDPALPARFGQALCVIARRSDHAPLRSLLPQLNKLITILQSPG